MKKLIHLIISFSAFGICFLLASLADSELNSETFSLKEVIVYIFSIQWIVFIPAYLLKSEKFYDLTVSCTYVFAVIFVLYNSTQNIANLILGGAIIFWAVRLGIFLFFRIKKAGEDKRFREIKTSFARFFLLWTISGMWVSFCSMCALTAIASNDGVIVNNIFYIGLVTFIIGLSIEIIADSQKTKFRKDPKNKDKFINEGLWAKSRHPNYVGEITLWAGVAIMSFSSLEGSQYISLISPIFTYLLLVYVSGVPQLTASGQKKWGHLESYQDYIKNTPTLII